MANLQGEDDVNGIADANCLMNDNSNIKPEYPILPENLIFVQIIARLPVKTLIRFKSVSKYWYSTISSPQFAKSHLGSSNSVSNQLILVNGAFKLMLLPFDERNNLKTPIDLGFTLVGSCIDGKQHYDVVMAGSCNGLVCLNIRFPGIFYELHHFVVCNPASHQYSEIVNPDPRQYSEIDNNPYTFVWDCWFGYIPSIDDYKIIALISFRKCYVNDKDVPKHHYVYSLRIGMWKRIDDLDMVVNDYGHLRYKLTVFDDFLYWSPQFLKGYKGRPMPIIGFDLANEQVKEFPMMDWLSAYIESQFYVMNGCLSLLCRHFNNAHDRLFDSLFDVWTLKQHDDWSSWEKSFTTRIMDPFTLTYTGKILVYDFVETAERKLSCQMKIMDISKDTQEQSQGNGYLSHGHETCIAGYVESLVSPFGTN